MSSYQYTSEARKAQYLAYREMGLKNTQVAEKAGIKRNTRHNIWARASQLEIDRDIPPPTIEELVAVKPRSAWMPIRISINLRSDRYRPDLPGQICI